LLAFEDNKCHKDIKKRVHLRKAMIKPKVWGQAWIHSN
jgi:hypothetical protein